MADDAYHAALSDAWHQNYQNNNPAGYAASYGVTPDQPENTPVSWPASQSVYERLTSALHSAVTATDPFGGAANEPNPLRAAAAGMRTAGMGMPFIAGPTAGFNALSNALSSSPTSAEDVMSAGDMRKQQINELEGKIAEEQRKRDAALNTIPRNFTVYDAHGNASKGRDPALIASKTASFDQNIGQLQQRLNPLYAAEAAATSSVEQSQKPWAETAAPWQKTAARWGPAAFDFGTSLPLGAFIKNPVTAYGLNALQGIILGTMGGFTPTFSDLALPPGSPGRIQAEKNLTDRNYWLKEVAPEVGYSTGSALLGTIIGQKMGAAWRAAKGNNPPSPSSSAMANPTQPLAGPSGGSSSAGAGPQRAYVDAQGRDVYLGANGKPMFLNKAGIFQYTHGPIVRREHRPTGWNALKSPD